MRKTYGSRSYSPVMNNKQEYYENISDVKKKALASNDKTEEDLENDIKIIREWIKQQPHLPEIASDKLITSFLMMNKFSIEKTKERLDMYYTMRSIFPEFFHNRHPLSPHMNKAMDYSYMVPLPKATEEGYRVMVLAFSREDLKDFDMELCFSVQYNVFEQKLQADYQVSDILIYDLKNATMSILSKLTPTILKKASITLEKTFNNRVKQLHFINLPPYSKNVISLIISCLNKKIAKRVHLHQSSHTLSDYIPTRILPKDYGGEEPTLKELNEIFKKELAAHKDRFDVLETLRVNESFRPTPLVNDEILGYYGNFKKLNVD
ncbi:alpha-tocopherol transfer protein-like isoform X2 [Leptinotarsa decemlineata]|uniref:alpha-tocopherol transfer protein-like isoform X2 n=1 Tax=Leptinotarsa decemlineata TaxID=7539 RepID=UPI003D30B0A3